MMSLDEAIRTLRSDPNFAELIRDACLDGNIREAAERFYRSAEFVEVQKLIGHRVRGAKILYINSPVERMLIHYRSTAAQFSHQGYKLCRFWARGIA